MTNPHSHLPAAAPTVEDVYAVVPRLAGSIQRTACNFSRTLSDICGANIWLKSENHQFTAAFKERGALNFLLSMRASDHQRGVVAMSAGNHGQGVAYHAKRLGIAATIVMPEGTPQVKIDNTRRYGAHVLIAGATVDDAFEEVKQLCKAEDLVLVHPFDDPAVIAGQGTIAIEMLDEVPQLDVLVVPIGGGGLISGMAIAAKSIKPDIEIIGVEAATCPTMHNVIKGTDFPVRFDTLAEGIAVKTPGLMTREIVRGLVDDIVLVSEAQLERAVATLITIEKTVAEGAGAAGLAAVMTFADRFAGRNVGLVLCGGNIDTRLLASVLTRDLAREGRISELAVALHDRPGQLARVANLIGDRGANVVEVLHQRVFTELPAKGAVLRVVIETRDREHLNDVIGALRGDGLDVNSDTSA